MADLKQITFWMYSKEGASVPPKQAKALKQLLRWAGASSVRKLANGAINARFDSEERLMTAVREVLAPLEQLFGHPDLRSVWDNPFTTKP